MLAALAATVAVVALPLHGKTVAIDPGHNGANWSHPATIKRLVSAGTFRKACDTTGTATNAGYSEAAYTFDVATRLAADLRELGARVVLTRVTNIGVGPCINERAAIGNRARADAAISIHADGGPASGRGFHVIYAPPIPHLTAPTAAASARLARIVRDAFRAGTSEPVADYVGEDGLNVRSDLGGLNLSTVPKVLIETGNMRNATDAALLSSPSYRGREAYALAQALKNYLLTTVHKGQ
jgi:N-acetylmuramoyl-L-alanine amidase